MLSTKLFDKLVLKIIRYKKGMITTLPKLNSKRVKISGTKSLNNIILILLKQPPINLLLFFGHFHINNHLIQLGNGLFNIFLNSSQ